MLGFLSQGTRHSSSVAFVNAAAPRRGKDGGADATPTPMRVASTVSCPVDGSQGESS